MASQDYTHFMQDPDAPARLADFGAFVGPNVKAFLPAYERLRATENLAPGQKAKFSWAGNGFNAGAFFGGPVWFFYRRMWAWAWGLTIALALIGLIPGTSRIGLPVGVGLALGGNQIYVAHAVSKIAKMRAAGQGSIAELQRAGGVSKLAAWISGILYVLLTALAIYAVITLGPDAIK